MSDTHSRTDPERSGTHSGTGTEVGPVTMAEAAKLLGVVLRTISKYDTTAEFIMASPPLGGSRTYFSVVRQPRPMIAPRGAGANSPVVSCTPSEDGIRHWTQVGVGRVRLWGRSHVGQLLRLRRIYPTAWCAYIQVRSSDSSFR